MVAQKINWNSHKFSYNHAMTKRTLFIGDVHGCYDELMALCTMLDLRDDDYLYFVGDLINK